MYMYMYMYPAESLCCSPESTTTLLIGYTTIQSKKFKVTKKRKEMTLEQMIYNY